MSEATARPHSARDLTAFQQTILVVLAESSRYGLAIKRELEDYYGEEVNHGRLYPNLDDLVGGGLIEKSELDKRTNEYALTDEGLAAVEDLLAWSLDRYVTDEDRAEFVEGLVEDATAD
jgi:DNA-binding PadR family transcriptional regulator